ncbi:MAG: glutamate--tRNA ligase, partial [Alphaproteobacteria bacterium]|nr:glutamate--tRNA ligase [Alphaproteobacteria bacterium]
GIEELKARSKTLLQFVDESAFYARSIPYAFDEKALALLGESKAILAALEDELESLEPFTGESIQNLCQKIAGDLAEGKLGKVAMPLRAAVTGTTVSPSIFGACAVLGRKETCARIRFAVQQGK